MEKERIGIAIVSNQERVSLRPRLQKELEKIPFFEVILLSRENVSRIRREIKREEPDLVLVTTSLKSDEEFNDLWGFVSRLRKHLPQTIIVIQAPPLHLSKQEKLLEAGANSYIDHRLPYEMLGGALKKIIAGEDTANLYITTKRKAA